MAIGARRVDLTDASPYLLLPEDTDPRPGGGPDARGGWAGGAASLGSDVAA